MKRILVLVSALLLMATVAYAMDYATQSSEYPTGIFVVDSSDDGMTYTRNPHLLKLVDWHDGNGPVNTWIDISKGATPEGLTTFSIHPVDRYSAAPQNLQGVR